MIKILIIEDEIPARKKLKRFIEAVEMPHEIIAEIDTVEDGIDFLLKHQVDLIFSDIELLDGNAFEIYQEVKITCPIIFTTAYDQFLMKAFENNGIGYLLKPFSKDRFQKAWDKFILLNKMPISENQSLSQLTELIKHKLNTKTYKKRFIIHSQKGIYFLEVENIGFFQAQEGVVFAYDFLGKKHMLTETSLKEIEEQLKPIDFFRINRSEIVQKSHIVTIERYNKNSLAVKIKAKDNYLKTSQSNTARFRAWLEE